MNASPTHDDHELLRRYVETDSQEAFAALVTRHTDLVWSSALRLTGGDPHEAEDVAQTVFAALAVKSARLKPGVILPGWLLNATRYAAADLRKLERRRKRHERNAAMSNTHVVRAGASVPAGKQADREQTWSRVAPVLDEALAQLGDSLRLAVVLRFFERKSMRDVAGRLGISEAAARQRVCRGLEKLRDALGRRSVSVPLAGLASLLAANAVHAAPAGVATCLAGAASVAAAATGGAKTVAGSHAVFALFGTWTKGAAAVWAVVTLVGGAGALVAWDLTGKPAEETVRLAAPAQSANARDVRAGLQFDLATGPEVPVVPGAANPPRVVRRTLPFRGSPSGQYQAVFVDVPPESVRRTVVSPAPKSPVPARAGK
jgi:RNA polymerase sigma factor (sigma-70 family)